MPKNKVFRDFDAAVGDVPDGATVFFGGFAGPGGFPSHLTWALYKQGARNLTVVCNIMGDVALGMEFLDLRVLFLKRQVRKAIASYPVAPTAAHQSPFELLYRAGEVELELVPQGTLAERIRAGGAGIPAFYTPTGVGTPLEEGKEKRVFQGRQYILEYALQADYAFIRAHKADRRGNLVYRGTARNFNPIMAMAARVSIAEVDEVVELGGLGPDVVVTPGIFIDRIVPIPPGSPHVVAVPQEVKELDVKLREEMKAKWQGRTK